MAKQQTREPGERLLRRPDVEQRTGKSRSGIYLDMREGRFPLPVRIGMRAVAWRESDVQAWIDERRGAAQ